jgi:hypothetical protein
MAEGYVVKLVYDDVTAEPSWVLVETGRRLVVPRDRATVFPDHEAAHSEATIWKVMSPKAYSVFVDPA